MISKREVCWGLGTPREGKGKKPGDTQPARGASRKMGPPDIPAVALGWATWGLSVSLCPLPPPTWPQSPAHLLPLAWYHLAPPPVCLVALSLRPHFEPFCLLHQFTNPRRACDWFIQVLSTGAHRVASGQDLPCLHLLPVLTVLQEAFHLRMCFELHQEGSQGPT